MPSSCVIRPTVLVALLLLGVMPLSAAKRERPAAPARAPFGADPYPSTYRPLPRQDVMIVDATILDGAGGRIDGGDILLRDGKIAAIGPDLAAETGTLLVDGRGKWVTPGIIDVHSHNGPFALPLTSIDDESSDVADLSGPNVADTWIEHAVNVQDPAFDRALEGGVTTLHILPGSKPIFGGRSVVLKPVPANRVSAMKFPDARPGLKMACGENPKSFGAGKGGPTSRQGVAAFIRTSMLKAKKYADGAPRGKRRGRAAPPERDLKMESLAGVLTGEIDVHMHCYRADDMAVMMDIARELGFTIKAFHHAEEAYKIAPLLREQGICSAVWADWWGFKMEASDGIRENAPFLDAIGACAIIHSDSPQAGQRLNLEAAKAAGAGRRAGLSLPPERIIAWITSNPAKALGLGDRIGTLALGRNADLVIWSGDPFSVYTKADKVFIDGAVAFDREAGSRRPRSDFELGRPQAERQR
jgi:imidazolonepropionase-like amidohydrolase